MDARMRSLAKYFVCSMKFMYIFSRHLTASQRQEQPVIVKYDNEFLEMDDKRQKPLRQYQLYTSED